MDTTDLVVPARSYAQVHLEPSINPVHWNLEAPLEFMTVGGECLDLSRLVWTSPQPICGCDGSNMT